MPTNYTGDLTDTQAPSPAPGPEVSPIGALPADGDPPNASTFEQPYKVALDFIDWLLKPRGVSGLATRFLHSWRTSLGHRRASIDRLGMPAHMVLQWQELWDTVGGFSNNTPHQTGALFQNLPAWWDLTSATLTGTTYCSCGPTVRDRFGVIPTAKHAQLRVRTGDGTSEFRAATRWGSSAFLPDADIALEFVAACDRAGSSSSAPESYLGFIESVEPGDIVFEPRASRGLRFMAEEGEANWQAISVGAGGETQEDTGIPVSTGAFMRFRIEWRGANVNDGAAAAAYFFIEGTHVATITTNLPTDVAAQVMFSVKNIGGAITRPVGTDTDLRVRPVNFVCNLSHSV